MTIRLTEKLKLFKDKDNVLHLSESHLKKILAEDQALQLRKLFVQIKMHENRISHFAKDSILDLLKFDQERQKKIAIIVDPEYPLPVSYNIPTKQMIMNLSYFGETDISNIENIRELYATTLYMFCFSKLVEHPSIVKDEYAGVIINLFNIIFVRVFGKEFGLLGAYEKEIIKMKFFISCYILSSFFGISNPYKRAYTITGFNYKEIENELTKIDFTDARGLIKALNVFNVFPGINEGWFLRKCVLFLGLSFVPAIEDAARFISILSTSSISGITIVKTHIKNYNITEFEKIMGITKRIFK
jgi:hypothetical protein